jgi:tRNA pseudouridine32 synthase/23S rRNA pseudouridine746 synthase
MLGRVTPLYVDPHLLVLDKPAGMLAVPGRTESDCLAARAQALWPDARVVHRLDMATSGLMVFARGATVQRQLSQAFAARRVQKVYVAVVQGLPVPDDGDIALPLGADWPRRPRQRVDAADGRPSLTRYRVLARDAAAGRTRLALEPVTGRTHQLRVHLAAVGHPIVGDTLYGGPAAARLMLHAERLSLTHPMDGRPLDLRCAAPF